ncbi:MAG: hypothetical protein L3K26_00790 [Candidatus Hydrogenedentes bacterium]|nr:hypothetical protein [Candidatus Hydrogenedentota bacterium]
MNKLYQDCSGSGSFCLPNYFEDDGGQELSIQEVGAALSGNPHTITLPAGMKKHEIEYALSEKTPIPIDQVSFSQERIELLGYFVRDLKELENSEFYKNGPGTLSNHDGLKTAVSDEEIRSFVTIFRRLYMQKERANFVKAVEVFASAIRANSRADFVSGLGHEYSAALNKPPETPRSFVKRNLSFTRKKLLDSFIYTQYAHQPHAQKQRQFEECFAAVGDDKPVLTWLFLTEIWKSALLMSNAGQFIAHLYAAYCEFHSVTPRILGSIAADHRGFGTLEKNQDHRNRVLREQTKIVADSLWKEAGCPSGGLEQFISEARRQLKKAME